MKKLLSLEHQLRTRRQAAGASQRGMTLIEIMVVVAIISLVLGGVGLMAFNQFKNAQLDTAQKDVVQIQAAVEMYMTQKRGKCPKTLQDLKASGIAAKVSKDPWGKDYQLQCPGEHTAVDVISGGPDGEVGTEDDINNYTDEVIEEEDGK